MLVYIWKAGILFLQTINSFKVALILRSVE